MRTNYCEKAAQRGFYNPLDALQGVLSGEKSPERAYKELQVVPHNDLENLALREARQAICNIAARRRERRLQAEAARKEASRRADRVNLGTLLQAAMSSR